MVEKDYYAKITKYYIQEALRIKNNISWEAKITKTNRIPFSCLMDHQEESLLASERVLGEKIEDSGIRRKPFDGFVLYKATALFIAIYFLPRQTEIYEIPIRSFLEEKYKSGNKSLTKERASEIGKLIHLNC